MRRIAIRGEEIAGHIIVRTDGANRCRILRCNCPVLRTTVGARWGDSRHPQVVNHPAFVPARLVVNHEQSRDVRKQIYSRTHIVGISRKTRLWLKCDSNRTDGPQLAVGPGSGWFGTVVYAGHYCGKDVWFEASCIEQIVLEKLTRLFRFTKGR